MCKFLSAIYTATGDLICAPQYTDSHSELLTAHGIQARNTTAPVQQFVRLELTPSDQTGEWNGVLFLSFEKWQEHVDEHETPSWFDEAARFDAFEQMRDILRAAANCAEELKFGGLAFVAGKNMTTRGTRVTALSGSHVTAESGSNVTALSGSHVTAESGSHVTALSGSRVMAESGSNVTALSGSHVTARFGSRVMARFGSRVMAWSGSHVTALSGSHVTAESGSNVTAESDSNVTAESGSNVTARFGSRVTKT